MDSAVTCNEEEMEAEEKHNSEEEIEFVGEEQLRPVLECVDLLSSDDETQALNVNRTIKDHVDCQKDRVASTLERLARHVEESKQQKAEKNRAFQEKLNFQHAHGLQELEFIKDVPGKQAAKMCVKEWLNMPGLRPGCVSASRRNFSRSRESISVRSQSIICPVMKCNRKFDNGQLLLGHLKRFDHSPCDPTIALHGVCDHSTYACVLCLKRFGSMKEYDDHFSAKAKLTDGHERHIPPLLIQCFACPSCFVLFYQRDECLKHMSARNHFRRTIVLKDQRDAPCPVPMPAYAKNVLIALCKDILFQIVCTACRLELRSYTELTAHFRTRCRNAGPVSLSEKSIVDVAAVFRLEAYCPYCKLALNTDSHIVKHTAKTSHKIRRIASIEESILVFCYINEGTKTPSDICLSAANDRLKPCTLKRTLHNTDISSNILQKCKKESKMATINDWRVKTDHDVLIKAWFCECLQKFPSEKAAEKHIMTANRIFHKCLVCGKLAEDLGIIHLHMSRFHGGAHLSNFRFWCQICLIELVRVENVMAHVSDIHGGHSFYYEEDVFEQPSTSTEAKTPMLLEADLSAVPQQASKGMWQCHICEEMFDSEETVKQHCKSLTIHQFHKYICDTCKKKFHKLETLFRHCQNQHDGDIKTKYFCGLCEDLYLDEEKDFLAHYESFHGLDYGFVPNQIQSPSKTPAVTSTSSTGAENHLTCGCLVKYTDKAKRKEDRQLCLAKLFEKGKLWYSCSSCSATDQTIEGIRRHLCKKGTEQISSDFLVKCSICSKSFHEAEHAQLHYHTKHCFHEKPYIISTPCESKNEVFKFTAGGSRVSKQPLLMEKAHTEKLHYEALGKPKNMSGSSTVKNEVESMDIGLTDTAHAETSSGMSLVMPKPFSTSTENKDADLQPMDAGFEESDLPDLEFLQTMTHIVFVDLDNWAQFFTHLPGQLNQGTFVWGFQGGKNIWKPPINCKIYKYLSNTGCFFLHPRCSNRKDAADFAICMHAGRLDEKLPKQIPFTILSGDKGFLELENQFKKTQRPAHILNPHHLGGDMMCALLNSIAETTQDLDDTEKSTVEQEEEANIDEAIRRSLVEM
ncbi:E3 SUMO-protein ligase ZNF451 [Bufo gargarizans]|uniref:E3 SUMO-protein ligase ZNF451 n=1 Tax=Bufo gargarizans TaxID=30331 RepID=UPI001CF29F34|nr:E3 SUMO-protein ligase ZNF451 [Bufo gargarizans]XP_044148468.1 E3 SUMO-protein ligase ZNF451 [Bufo gargarizans]XP_044148469.1 E3 SUMO-protein ligase ZNF451 [Bufo gargarizans]